MKWLKAFLAAAILATMFTVPSGCGSGKIEAKKGGEAVPAAEGHAGAASSMGKKPADVK